MKNISRLLAFAVSLSLLLFVFVSCGKPKYTVGFAIIDDEVVESIELREYELIPKPEDPKREGFIFDYWMYKGDRWNFEIRVVSSDMILQAHWNPIIYIVKYNLDGGENSDDNRYNFTALSDTFKLYEPKKDGYEFLGWYLEDTFVTKIDTVYSGTIGDITVYAKWAEK